ncbi:MAG: 4-hydroxybutyrate CoA-transferase [Proteobacteria bacterium]|nr:MAG: 4-hydroxybutyrate CoA-transferase [Pseudomonadota bacterium]
MSFDANWRNRALSADDAVKLVQSRQRVFIHGACATPTPLVDALSNRQDLEGVQLYHIHLDGDLGFTDPSKAGQFFSNSLFTGRQLRKPIAEGRADFVPVFLSDIPGLFESGRIPLDVAIIQLSPPDAHGNCTLGPSVDTALAAAHSAKTVIAEINEQMPRTCGNTVVPMSKVTAFVCTDRPLHTAPARPEGEVEGHIGEIIAGLIQDGSTLQMGIGGIPDAVLSRLFDKHDLGVHTEMFSDNVIDLCEAGVITNKFKEVHRGRITTSFAAGSQRLFDFIDDNQMVEFYPCDRTNDTAMIRKNPKVVAINSAIELDLSGQVCSDSMGHTIFSGIGGQMDFIRGAALSRGGLPIIALPSTAKRGQISRISGQLKPGAGVVTTRGHVHWVVTEYGAVNLHGLTLKKRAEALISIAHPDFRADLRNEVAERRNFVF